MRSVSTAIRITALLSIFLAGLSLGNSAAQAATSQAVIDFESGLGAGDIVGTLDVGKGISGDDLGQVAVNGFRSDLPGVNQAMIFDATCGGGPASSCSGGDADLYQPGNGNVLIISEDNDSSDPDDAVTGEEFLFDFSAWGTGTVTVVSVDVLDVEADESPGAITVGGATVSIPDIGDGNIETIPVGLSGNSMTVTLNGSGAIDNIVIEVTTTALTNGRFTGGGRQIRIDGVRVTHGLTIHCDLLLSNNLQVNWTNGNSFHMLEHLETVECSDDPNIIQAPPPAPLDTLVGLGQGRFNGEVGYSIQFKLVDYGEPGRNDRMAIRIFETANPGNVVLDVPLQVLSGGNLQAHYDQPHGGNR